ncbi:hypothetical protein RBB78_19195 [Tunturiibacter empetritectus]|uniref:hypothetical protein n=1 Tax=Tunturiibacter empetritectus TaxID=3069691 RepID=UPI003D9AD86E
MKREYHKWFSPSLGRDMELLVFGHAGYPAVVFPTSQGRFYEFEDRQMVSTVQDKLEHGHLQLYCVDSVDGESWYNRDVLPVGALPARCSTATTSSTRSSPSSASSTSTPASVPSAPASAATTP